MGKKYTHLGLETCPCLEALRLTVFPLSIHPSSSLLVVVTVVVTWQPRRAYLGLFSVRRCRYCCRGADNGGGGYDVTLLCRVLLVVMTARRCAVRSVFLASVELSINKINKNLNLKNLLKGPNNDVRRLDLFIL